MKTDPEDRFLQFAERYELQIEIEDVASAPRDILAAPADLEWCTLITLRSAGPDAQRIQTVFTSDPSDTRPPNLRDALWWLASDSWAIERSNRDIHRWAATYHYPDGQPATQRLFNLHRARANALVALLGQPRYEELLSVYESELQRIS
ncbi:MAG TPA: hypothetical protein VN650_08990 [Gemmatimonadaceae bacterium]|nr:hypothetical protein [Gemmatimonadaceae bacterium]